MCLQSYMKEHQYKTTVTDDLWSALSKVLIIMKNVLMRALSHYLKPPIHRSLKHWMGPDSWWRFEGQPAGHVWNPAFCRYKETKRTPGTLGL